MLLTDIPHSRSTNDLPTPILGKRKRLVNRRLDAASDDHLGSDAEEDSTAVLNRYDELMRSTWAETLQVPNPIDPLKQASVASDAGECNLTLDGEDVSNANEQSTGATGAKRRKMDKKRLKREEQKRVKSETVESAEFRLFRSQAVRPISLLPAPSAFLATENPRHRIEDEVRRSFNRTRIEQVAVEGTELLGQGVVQSGVGRSSRSWRRKLVKLPEAISPWPPVLSSETTLMILSNSRTSSSRPPTTLLPTSELPLTQRGILIAHRPKPLTKAERKEVEAWRAARDVRMGVKTRLAERGGAAPGPEGSVSLKTIAVARPRRVARYFAPAVGIGGKARGYGWGFLGSREGSRDQPYA